MIRFWAKVNKTADCWEWTGTLSHNGYGRMRIGKRMVTAHRFSWELVNPPTPLLLCHHCDNPKCVRPSHLFAGTQKENIEDRDRKGRGIDGVKNGRAVLSPSQVRHIKTREWHYGDASKLSREMGVSVTQVVRIRKNIAWANASL